MNSATSDERSAWRTQLEEWFSANATLITEHDPWAVSYTTDGAEADAHFHRGVAWQQKLHDAGLAGLAVPTDYGGQGGASWQQRMFNEIAAQYEESPGFIGSMIAMLVPTLLAHGTEEQKLEWIPKVLSAEVKFCQLFSEPGAGSDLATLGTSAMRDGDMFVLNGQKVWNSGAQYADWGFVLCRTDPDVMKHAGITFMLVDMSSPGVEVRPLVQMTGAQHFNEVFLTDVSVPVENVIGEINGGWAPARTVLSNESAFIGRGGPSAFDKLRLLAETFEVTGDAKVRQGLAEMHSREIVQRAMATRLSAAARSGERPPVDGSMLKVFATNSRIIGSNLATGIAGPHAMSDLGPMSRWVQAELGLRFTMSIGGGTTEVQKNNIGERMLGLPREPRPDKDLAWRDIPR